jgi:hypothetical protein
MPERLSDEFTRSEGERAWAAKTGTEFLAKRPATPSLRSGIPLPERQDIPPCKNVSFDVSFHVSFPMTHQTTPHTTLETIPGNVVFGTCPVVRSPLSDPLCEEPFIAFGSSSALDGSAASLLIFGVNI